MQEIPTDFLKLSRKIKFLGSGSYGEVWLYKTPIGKIVIKETKINKSFGYPSVFFSEADMLQKLSGLDSVISLNGICFETNYPRGYLFLEKLDGDLFEWASNVSFEERMHVLPQIIKTIASALAIMHKFSLLHGDIKLNNMLYVRTRDGYNFKLTDFGHSMIISDPNISYKAATIYLHPEKRNVFISEFWAFMVSMIEIILGGGKIVKIKHGDREIEIKTLNNFYELYLIKRKNKFSAFDLKTYLTNRVSPKQFEKIPSLFWNFFEFLISGEDTTIEKSLNHIGVTLNINDVKTVENNLYKTPKIHEDFIQIKSLIYDRMVKDNLTSVYSNFSKLMNKFLEINKVKLCKSDLKLYAEVAYIIVSKNKFEKLEYFEDLDILLKYQRNFSEILKYQTSIP